MARMLDAQLPGWRDECSQDTAIVANHLAEWAIARVGVDPIAAVRAPAITAAQLASGWRLECGTVREFAKFDPVRVWFRFPLHTTDANVLLLDAMADGEVDTKRRKKAVEAVQNTIDADVSLAYADLAQKGGPVTVTAMADAMQCDADTVRRRIAAGAKRGAKLRYEKGVVHEETATATEG